MSLPNHVAIIMDGNGRWAERRGLPRMAGHRAGVERIRPVIKLFTKYGIKYLTLYSFSTENWSRPEDEVQGLFQLLEETIARETPELHRQGAKIQHLGRLQELPPNLQSAIKDAIDLTKNNSKITINVALNYGGRTEIVDAVCCLIDKGIPTQDIDEKLFSDYLYTAGLPDIDLMIRTGGEKRVSNFLMWQAAYAEYYFTNVLWPDFAKRHLDWALKSYSQRQRRFGGL